MCKVVKREDLITVYICKYKFFNSSDFKTHQKMNHLGHLAWKVVKIGCLIFFWKGSMYQSKGILKKTV